MKTKIKMKRNIRLLVGMMIMMLAFAGCTNNPGEKVEANSSNVTEKTNDHSKLEPVTIDTFNHKLTFDKVPEKVVALNYDATQILLALGLQDKIVGVATAEGDVGDCLPEYQEELGKLKIIGEGKPSFEVLLKNQPDFVFATAFSFGKNGIAPIEDFINHDIKFYVTKGTYESDTTVTDVYEDISNIGKIFRVEDKAEKLISELKLKEKKFNEKLSKNEPVKTFAYDSGEKQVFTAGQGIESDIIRIAGGKNIFDDIDKQFASVSWEEVAKRNPQLIVIHDYNTGETSGTLEEKIQLLKSHPALQEVDAIKNNNFVAVKLIEVFPGLQVFDAIEKIQNAINK